MPEKQHWDFIMKIKYFIPNFFTAASLVVGFLSINASSEGNFVLASWLIALSIFCDGFDGKVARLLNASSRFGAEFDSMSDFVAFGVAPGFLVYKLGLNHMSFLGFTAVIIYVLAGAIRLVRFNLKNYDLDNKHPFEGLPIPGAAGMLASLYLFMNKFFPYANINGLLIIVTFLVAFLMVSNFEFLTIEHKNNYRAFKIFRAVFMVFIIISLAFFPNAIFFGVFALYVTVNTIRGGLFHKNNNIENEVKFND